MKTLPADTNLASLEASSPSFILTEWRTAITNFHRNYYELVTYIRQRGIEHESTGGNIAYSGQFPVSQLMKLAGSMQTELTNLAQDMDQIDPLKPPTTKYDQLVRHTLRLNQLNDQAQPMLELADDKKMIVVEKIKSLIHEIVEDAAQTLKLKNSDYISNKLDYGYTYLSSLFSRVTGTTIEHYLIIQRIEKAKELLLHDELSLSQIADKLQYSSVAYLCRQFKKITGLTPSSFKHLKARHPKAQQDDEALFFDQLSESLSWSLSDRQRHYYHQSLRRGHTLVVTNLTKTILWTSHSFSSMTGYNPIDVLGKTSHFLQGPDTDPGTLRFIREQLNVAQPVEAELVNYRSNGDPYVCHLQIEPLRNKRGEVTHFTAVEYAVN
jgi:PAS domain S-box-containing protein